MVAVYPCAPMAFWHQYQVLVKGGDAKVCALSDGQWQGVENRENWTALLTAQYPSCLTLEKDGESLGTLPNILDKEPDAGGNQPAIASIDLGTAVTAVTLTIGGREIPATHRPLLRMLLTLSDTPMDDMMTSLTMAANLIPTAVVLTGAGDVPGRDGYVYRPADMAALAAKEENRLLTGFKWRSDAAGVLVGLNRLWETGLTRAELEDVGLTLGADVPFCIRGGLTRTRGIGEAMEALPCGQCFPLVVIQPCGGLSTRDVFAAYHAQAVSFRPDNDAAQAALADGNLRALSPALGNVLQPVSEQMRPAIADAIADLRNCGVAAALMTGSGSAVFGAFETEQSADAAFAALSQRYDRVFRCETCMESVIEQI